MLSAVLDIQSTGDRQKARDFIEQYSSWTPDLHERLARQLRASSRYQFLTVRYRALQ